MKALESRKIEDIKPTVLVVDDDVGFLSLMEEELSSYDLTVTLVYSGYEAIACLETSHFDLVISDYRMQNGDGVSLSHYCHKRGVKCIVFTGSEAEVVRHYLPVGTQVIEKFDSRGYRGIVRAIAPLLHLE